MTPDPATCPPGTPIAEAARIMRDRRVGSLLVTDEGGLRGILTIRDVSGRVVAGGLDPQAPVARAMTPDPLTLPPDAIGSDVLHAMMERGIGHVPIVGEGGLVGIVTQTDLTRFQAESSAQLVGDAAEAEDVAPLTEVTARIPRLLAQLVGAGLRHEVVTRLITGVADAVTRRLLVLAEEELGPPPVPYLWLACGSQGRREQTGVSDQDNCLILSDDLAPEHDAYFAELARFVCEGLDRCGYVLCPGEMMATNPRWRQPLRVWRGYFAGWIATPDPMAQMLASVMFDLRPIGGDPALHEGLQAETLRAARANSIFVAHMVSNSLHHAPPLGLFGGLATLRRGEHRRHIDLKLSGVVPRRRSRPDLRPARRADGGGHPREARGRARGGRDQPGRRARPPRRLRPHRPDPARAPGAPDQGGRAARQLPRAVHPLGLRAQPPARRLRGGAHYAVGRGAGPRRAVAPIGKHAPNAGARPQTQGAAPARGCGPLRGARPYEGAAGNPGRRRGMGSRTRRCGVYPRPEGAARIRIPKGRRGASHRRGGMSAARIRIPKGRRVSGSRRGGACGGLMSARAGG